MNTELAPKKYKQHKHSNANLETVGRCFASRALTSSLVQGCNSDNERFWTSILLLGSYKMLKISVSRFFLVGLTQAKTRG